MMENLNFPTNYMQEVIKVIQREIKQHPHKVGYKSKYYGKKVVFLLYINLMNCALTLFLLIFNGGFLELRFY